MNIRRYCYPNAIILQTVYFKLKFTLSYRQVASGVKVDHVTTQRSVYKFTSLIKTNQVFLTSNIEKRVIIFSIIPLKGA